jgi:adenosylcobinamide-GDP ribazoletransferase
MRAFFTGLQFLTRISIVRQDNWTAEDFGRSVKYFPLIGAVLGAIYAAFAYGFYVWLPARGIVLPTHLTAAILLILPPIMTGGLHCDGFMDTMDGVFSGRSRERMLEIMKDSCTGSNAVFCFVILMFWEFAILLDMPKAVVTTALFVMPIVARLMMVAGITLFPYARPDGLGKAFAQYAGRGALTFAAVCTLVLTLPLGRLAWASLAVCAAFTAFFGNYVEKRLGGLTGDVYGAITTLNEGLVLLTFLIGVSIL